MKRYLNGEHGKSCATPDCKNKRAGKANFCSTCRSRAYRAKHPGRAAYYNLKHRAKERKIKFELTRFEFLEWCRKTGYDRLKGRHAEGMSVDRIRENESYNINNIQMMTLSENSVKSHKCEIEPTPEGETF